MHLIQVSKDRGGKEKYNIKSSNDYMDCECKLQSVISERSEPWSASTAQEVNHVIA